MDPLALYPLQLLDVRLYEAVIERIQPEETTGVAEAGTDYIPASSLTVNTKTLRHQDSDKVSVFLTIEIIGPAAERPEFRLHFTLEGFFEAQVDLDTLDEAAWQEFEQVSSITLLWPYAREYTQSFSQRMRADLLALPTLNRLALEKIWHQTPDEVATADDSG